VHQYVTEIQTCFRLGHRWKDRLTLAAAGLEFHLSNFLSLSPDSTPTTYGIRLGGIRDVQLRRRSGDFFVFHELFTSRYYHLADSLVPTAPAVIVDLGANIGLATLFLADRFPGARHFCVEPNPGNLPLLRANLSWLTDRLTILEGAASGRRGDARFLDSDWTGGGHLVENGPSTRSVRCVPVDEIIATHRLEAIDILKVNIEGAEKEIFAARPDWLTKVRCIVIELHNGYSSEEFGADVAPSGFDVLEPGSEFGNSIVVAVRAASLARSLYTSDRADRDAEPHAHVVAV
jgi:FkbM family methyltransferase